MWSCLVAWINAAHHPVPFITGRTALFCFGIDVADTQSLAKIEQRISEAVVLLENTRGSLVANRSPVRHLNPQ